MSYVRSSKHRSIRLTENQCSKEGILSLKCIAYFTKSVSAPESNRYTNEIAPSREDLCIPSVWPVQEICI